MNIEDKIKALIDAAAPLRLLADDDTDKIPLAAIVDNINALRAKQAAGVVEVDDEDEKPVKRVKKAD